MLDPTRLLNLEMENLQKKIGLLEYNLSRSNFDEVYELEEEILFLWNCFEEKVAKIMQLVSELGYEIEIEENKYGWEEEIDKLKSMVELGKIRLAFIRLVYYHVRLEDILLVQIIPNWEVPETGERRENGKKKRK